MVQTLHASIHTYDAMLEMSTTAAPQTHHRSTEPDTKLMQDVAPDHKQECKKQNCCNVLQIVSMHGRSRTGSTAA